MKIFSLNVGSVRVMIMAGALLAAILPVVFLGAGSVTAVKALVKDDDTDQSEILARNLAEQFDEFLVGQTNAMAVVALQLTNIDPSDTAAIKDILTRVRPNFPLAQRHIYTSLKGAIISAVPEVSDGQSVLGTDLSNRSFFKEVVRTGQPVIERSATLSRNSVDRIIAIGVPVKDRNGTLKAILSESIYASTVQSIINRTQRGLSGKSEIATADGVLLADSDTELLKKAPDVTKLSIWKTMQDTNSSRIDSFYDFDNQQRIGAFATVPSSGWKIWVSRTTSELEKEATDTYRTAIIWVVVAVALAGLGAFVLAQRFSAPIETLRQLTGNIADGDLTKRAPERGPQEIADLGKAINRMAASIQRSVETERNAKARLESTVLAYGRYAAQVAGGDLAKSIPVEGNDELAQLGLGLNRMTESLGRLVTEIRGAVGGVESAATEILAATNQQVAATAEEATAVRQTAATVLEVRQTAEVAARKTRLVAEMAERMESIAQDGKHAVEESTRGSGESKSRMEALAERILAFSDQAQEIAEINATVGNLAEQSNLLAVNASIEAAKAGEAGRGFAVVAVEVKELAERCKEATAQVRRIVTDIQKSAQGAVMAAEQGVKIAEQGMAVTQRSGNAIGVLSETVTEASQAAKQVLATAEQQEAGMEQIALSMQNIEQSSAQTVSATQQMERAAKDLSQLARGLSDIIRAMKVMEAG